MHNLVIKFEAQACASHMMSMRGTTPQLMNAVPCCACHGSRSLRWHCFNDRSCSEIGPETVQSPSAYLLFFKRKDVDNMTLSAVFPRTNDTAVDPAEILKTNERTCTIM